MRVLALVVMLCVASTPACLAPAMYEVQQQDLRGVLLNLYESQIMDNLVRIRRGLPIVHLDYTTMIGQVKIVASGNAGVTGANDGATDSLMLGVSASTDSSVNVTAKPVTDDDEVYLAYLRFADDQSLLREDIVRPDAEEVHEMAFVDGTYYWVPREARRDFLALALDTTVLRGKAMTIDSYMIDAFQATPEERSNTVAFTIEFSPPIPNDSGELHLDVPKRGRLSTRITTGSGVGTGAARSSLVVSFRRDEIAKRDSTPEEVREALIETQIRVKLDHYRPTKKTLLEITKTLLDATEQIRANDILNR